ncbi:unnamed protein product [marine sediment metagenome]|uniref:Uncharacterized protein n=1 Tax=marine sediment metagenome TaxID=412755 RepID=X0Y784_9ZZZZ
MSFYWHAIGDSNTNAKEKEANKSNRFGNDIEDFALLGGLFGFIDDEIGKAKRKKKEEEEFLDQETDKRDTDDLGVCPSNRHFGYH